MISPIPPLLRSYQTYRMVTEKPVIHFAFFSKPLPTRRRRLRHDGHAAAVVVHGQREGARHADDAGLRGLRQVLGGVAHTQ
jgi:hypothetical protein